MLRHALANPQSKAYKHLVARCLQQESDAVLELTYHLGLVTINPLLEFVKVSAQFRQIKNILFKCVHNMYKFFFSRK